MYNFLIIFITIIIDISRSAPIESTKTKKLMPIDLSILDNNRNALDGSSLNKLSEASNFIKPSQQSNILKVDLSALRSPTIDKLKSPEINSFPRDNRLNDNSIQSFNELNSYENMIPDLDYEEYYPPLKIIPHNVYFNSWAPEMPGNDALTDFLYEEYKNGRLVSNGKRDYSLQGWEYNELPILPDQTIHCDFIIPKDYGINCEDFMKLINYYGKRNINKRNMFLSKGWGPSGSQINIPTKFGVKSTKDTKFKNFKKLMNLNTTKESLSDKTQGIRQKQESRKSNAHKWSVPHLFGSY